MMTMIKNIADKNMFIGYVIRFSCYVGFMLISFVQELQGSFRVKRIKDNVYDPLLNYKDKHVGERCFIVATGPSLTLQDLDLIKDEISFGMNSICKIYNKTGYRPTYYGIQDRLVYAEIKEYICQYYRSKSNVFIADRILYHFKDVDKKWNVFPLNTAYNAYGRWFKEQYKVKISDDIYRIVYDGFSITISLLQIAMYMGFKDIYLLGADCDFNKNDLHSKGMEHNGSVDTTLDTAAERNLAGYRAIKQYAEDKGIHIYNSTRGGGLELFERVSLDALFQRMYYEREQ